MKMIFKKVMCCMLSILLVFSASIVAFAENKTNKTPVIVLNDIDANPIYNLNDGTVVFDFSDYNYDILFTSGFSANIMELLSPEISEQIKNGEIGTLDIGLLLIDYLGFSEDIERVDEKLTELIMTIVKNMDLEENSSESIVADIDFDQYAEDLKKQMATAIKNMLRLKMNDDGTPANDNIGVISYPESLEYYYNKDKAAAYALAGEIGESIAEEIGYANTFVFTYDWRLDPIKNASLLADYIDNVKADTGAKKVSIISEGYGSSIATAYLAENEATAADSVKNFVTVSSEFLGTSLVGDFFKGDIVDVLTNITTYTSAYIRYTNDISDNPMTSFITWLSNYILNNEWQLQEYCIEIEKMLSGLNLYIEKSGIIDTMAKMPGMWALVPTNDYNKAIKNIFADKTDTELCETIDSFKNYQKNYAKILQNVKESGVNISIVASWDIQILPIGENCSVQSDGVVDTSYASFGAACIDLNNVAEAKKAVQKYDENHKHVSMTYDMLTPWYTYAGICKYIDASTCALPENTWFIKNMKHGTFNSESNSVEFLLWLVTAESERTVWQDVAYKQFMMYNRFTNPGILSADGITATDSQPGGYLLGDINLDGEITSLDSKIALSVANGTEYLYADSIAFKNGDINADGKITGDDAVAILMMSAGLAENMQSGIKFDYEAEQGSLKKSSYALELRPEYNPIKNQLILTAVVLNAKGSYNGNFVIKYDTEMFTFADAKMFKFATGYTVAGCPASVDGVLTCGYSSHEAVSDTVCDENGDLVIAVFYLDVSRNVVPTTLTAGASYFYDNDVLTFVEPITSDLDEDFFFMLGDADNNRYISAQDARKILRIAAHLEHVTDDAMFLRCDVNQDKKITASDARLVLRASAKLITSY